MPALWGLVGLAGVAAIVLIALFVLRLQRPSTGADKPSRQAGETEETSGVEQTSIDPKETGATESVQSLLNKLKALLQSSGEPSGRFEEITSALVDLHWSIFDSSTRDATVAILSQVLADKSTPEALRSLCALLLSGVDHALAKQALQSAVSSGSPKLSLFVAYAISMRDVIESERKRGPLWDFLEPPKDVNAKEHPQFWGGILGLLAETGSLDNILEAWLNSDNGAHRWSEGYTVFFQVLRLPILDPDARQSVMSLSGQRSVPKGIRLRLFQVLRGFGSAIPEDLRPLASRIAIDPLEVSSLRIHALNMFPGSQAERFDLMRTMLAGSHNRLVGQSVIQYRASEDPKALEDDEFVGHVRDHIERARQSRDINGLVGMFTAVSGAGNQIGVKWVSKYALSDPDVEVRTSAITALSGACNTSDELKVKTNILEEVFETNKDRSGVEAAIVFSSHALYSGKVVTDAKSTKLLLNARDALSVARAYTTSEEDHARLESYLKQVKKALNE